MIALGSAAADRAWEAQVDRDLERHDQDRCGACWNAYPTDLMTWCDRLGDWECDDCWDYYHGGDAA
ncbi:hypothetical protein [Actinomyces urogenitalis]|uniref:hypothetical protein n=1 Tax=Actinomyces urogenitalis TaxID=103621 RepID=UPI0029030CAA|nr:hypothetical protein [Actinomyces urogenitalis]MDU0864447.1 hypothetical protein [Actinomyces urogenitalis]MDU0874993.1 hypothetical protein [Actinomyces urogenitalis]MDU1565336.1 hypothetical protein [Actinomyces urogenitalis]MDU1640579.1 hypothetical protein [Actinomyces urogenitalis]MDU5874585.1 hypothetical protein [Actinomyces urogenitalis]